MSERITGTVKWFNNVKGYGFIVPTDGNMDDLFVHFRSIKGEGYRSLEEGDQVEYSIADGPKGQQAVDVVKTHGGPVHP